MEKFPVGQKTLQKKDAGTVLEQKCFTVHILQDCDLKNDVILHH